MWSEKKKTKPKTQKEKKKQQLWIRYQKIYVWKGFSSTKNSYLNHLLQDFEFKQ